MTQTCHFGMALVKELDKVLSGKVISGTGGSFCRNLDNDRPLYYTDRFFRGIHEVLEDKCFNGNLIDFSKKPSKIEYS